MTANKSKNSWPLLLLGLTLLGLLGLAILAITSPDLLAG